MLSTSGVAAPMMVASCLFPGVLEAFVWRDHLVAGLLVAGGSGPGAGGAAAPAGAGPVELAHSGRFRVERGDGGPGLVPMEPGNRAEPAGEAATRSALFEVVVMRIRPE